MSLNLDKLSWETIFTECGVRTTFQPFWDLKYKKRSKAEHFESIKHGVKSIPSRFFFVGKSIFAASIIVEKNQVKIYFYQKIIPLDKL